MTGVVVELRDESSGAGPTCRRVLVALPGWFGIEQSVEDYVSVADTAPTVVASLGGRDVGFLTVVRHSPWAAEVYVMGVLPEFHRQGVGRRLLEHAEGSLAADGVELLQVKTLSAIRHDEGYARTRAFYLASGFRPLEEFPNLWGSENPALQLVKVLPVARAGAARSPDPAGSIPASMLVLVTGAPGTGKSTVAEAVGRRLGCAVLAHDWAMSGLRPYPEVQDALNAMHPPGHGAIGWSILWALARSELRRGRSAVLDGVARGEEVAVCRRLADEEGARTLLVATECSDRNVHRQRIEGRRRLIPNWYELTWEDVAGSLAGWHSPPSVDLVLDAALPWELNQARLRALIDAAIEEGEGATGQP